MFVMKNKLLPKSYLNYSGLRLKKPLRYGLILGGPLFKKIS